MNIQAITDCTIWKLSRQDLAHLYNISLNLNKIARVFLEETFTSLLHRETQLLGLSCEDLYRDLLNRNKGLIKEVPLKYIASYLGITPQTLSQIRRRIMQNK